MDSIEEVKNYVNTLAPEVKGNVEILPRDEIPGGQLYHIGTVGKIEKFVPRIPRRAAELEDVTVPRVCVANTVLGCFIGHNACLHDFFNERDNDGGWYIYEFDFEFALYPSNKMAGDSSRSGEHWLVPYKAERWEYQAKIIGKVFFNSVRYFRVPDSRVPKGIVEAYVQVNPEETVGWNSPYPTTDVRVAGMVPVAVSRPTKSLSMRKPSSPRCSHFAHLEQPARTVEIITDAWAAKAPKRPKDATVPMADRPTHSAGAVQRTFMGSKLGRGVRALQREARACRPCVHPVGTSRPGPVS